MTGIGKFFLKINSYNPLGCAKHLHLGTIKNVSTVNYQSLNKWGVCCCFIGLFYGYLLPGRSEKMLLSHFSLDKNNTVSSA